MSRTFADDYRWQVQFQPAVQRIVTDTFGIQPEQIIFTSPETEDDRRYNTDAWITIEGHSYRMSQRIRRYTVGDEFTLRYLRPGARTEWQKVWAGFGDYLLYGRGIDRGRRLEDWFIGRMDIFRDWVTDHLRRGVDPPHVVKANRDGSSQFVAFSRGALPPEFTVAEDATTVARDVQWSIVKDARGMAADGHGAAVRWARAALGLDD